MTNYNTIRQDATYDKDIKNRSDDFGIGGDNENAPQAHRPARPRRLGKVGHKIGIS